MPAFNTEQNCILMQMHLTKCPFVLLKLRVSTFSQVNMVFAEKQKLFNLSFYFITSMSCIFAKDDSFVVEVHAVQGILIPFSKLSICHYYFSIERYTKDTFKSIIIYFV